MPSPSQPKKRLRTRAAILDAIEELMSVQGFRHTTVEDVARKAGVSRRTVYVHFQSKEDLGLSSIDRVFRLVYEEMKRVADSSSPPSARLRQILTLRILLRVKSVARCRQNLDDLFAAVRPAYMARRDMYVGMEAEIVAKVLTAGKQLGEFDFDDVAGTAVSLVLATNAFLPYSLSAAEMSAADNLERRLCAMVDLLMRSLAVR